MKNKIKKLCYFVIRVLFFYFPFFVLFAVAYHFFSKKFDSLSVEDYKILFSAIGFTAVLAGLSLRASSTTEDRDKKIIFYTAGERLFHSTLLFIVSAVLLYTAGKIDLLFKDNSLIIIFRFAIPIINILLIVPITAFVFFGLVYSWIALESLHKVLFKGWEKPLD